jgi:hypothetical protein
LRPCTCLVTILNPSSMFSSISAFNLSGPGQLRSKEEVQKIRGPPMAEWMEPKGSLHRLGCLKFGRLADFETSILSTFALYFESLKPCARSLRSALFPSENMSKSAGMNLTLASPITHRDMIKIFASMLHKPNLRSRQHASDWGPPASGGIAS